MQGYYFKDKEKEIFCIPHLFIATRFADGRVGLNYNPNILEELVLAELKGKIERKIKKQERLTKTTRTEIMHIPNWYGKKFREYCYGPSFVYSLLHGEKFEGDRIFDITRKIFDFIKVNYKAKKI